MKNWMIGADASTLLEVERCGGKFADHGAQGDALAILKRYGINMVRLRLWNAPYSPKGEPYGAGNCDLDCVTTLAKRAKALGLLWPVGKTPRYDAITRLVSAGVEAVRAFDPALTVMIHMDNGGNNALYREWFDSCFANGGADFECIGLSYYPFWHGTMGDLRANLRDIGARYGKELVVETSMGYTMEDYQRYEGLPREERKGMAARPALVEKIEYPMTAEGQRAFLRDLIALLRDTPGAAGYCWWEPCWLPVPGSQWATPAGRAYVGDPGPGGNEWANQALFDYDGNALPALEEMRRDAEKCAANR